MLGELWGPVPSTPTQSLPQMSVPETFRDVRDEEFPLRVFLQGLLRFPQGDLICPSGSRPSWSQSSPAWTPVAVAGAETATGSGEGVGGRALAQGAEAVKEGRDLFLLLPLPPSERRRAAILAVDHCSLISAILSVFSTAPPAKGKHLSPNFGFRLTPILSEKVEL